MPKTLLNPMHLNSIFYSIKIQPVLKLIIILFLKHLKSVSENDNCLHSLFMEYLRAKFRSAASILYSIRLRLYTDRQTQRPT